MRKGKPKFLAVATKLDETEKLKKKYTEASRLITNKFLLAAFECQ